MNGILQMWNGCIKTNFHGEEVPYEIYGKGKIVLEVDFVYKHGKSYHLQVHVEECNCAVAKSQ